MTYVIFAILQKYGISSVCGEWQLITVYGENNNGY